MEKLKEQNDRQILWIADLIGNQGKTFLGMYIYGVEDAFMLYPAKESDNAYRYQKEKIVVVDLARADIDDGLYQQVERYKNGMVCSNKYESCLKIAFDVKIIVLANELPNFNRWSIDRYDAYSLIEGDLTYVNPV